jgi:hypothetical protein
MVVSPREHFEVRVQAAGGIELSTKSLAKFPNPW